MEEAFYIEGKKELSGAVSISGSKNATLALIAASLLAKGKTVLTNIPRIKDVFIMIEILNYLNVKTDFYNETLCIDTSELMIQDLLIPQIKEFRASYYFFGSLLGRSPTLESCYVGGCRLGKRPIDLHCYALSQLGVKIIEEEQSLKMSYSKLKPNVIEFNKVSMGATINALLLASQIPGLTEIKNASKEPEVIEVIKMINLMGGEIIGAGTDHLYIYGKEKYAPVEFEVIPDRIEAGTFMFLGALLGNPLEIKKINPIHLEAVFSLFDYLEIDYTLRFDTVKIYKKSGTLKEVKIKTGPYPDFPSDLQPILCAFLMSSNQISVIQETVYESRFAHINELKKYGGNLMLIPPYILINGIYPLSGANTVGSDLRSTAALVVAALNSEGVSIVKGVPYMSRGYDNFIGKINQLNGLIKLIKQ